jgi:hypothetical protein
LLSATADGSCNYLTCSKSTAYSQSQVKNGALREFLLEKGLIGWRELDIVLSLKKLDPIALSHGAACSTGFQPVKARPGWPCYGWGRQYHGLADSSLR